MIFFLIRSEFSQHFNGTNQFEKKGVTMISGIKEYVEITDKGLIIITRDGEKQTIEADTIITALPLVPNGTLFESLEGTRPEADLYAKECISYLKYIESVIK